VVSQRIDNHNQDGLKKTLVTKNKCLVCMTIQPIVHRERPKFRAKIEIQHGTLIMKEKNRNRLEYIYDSKPHQLCYTKLVVTFSEYLP